MLNDLHECSSALDSVFLFEIAATFVIPQPIHTDTNMQLIPSLSLLRLTGERNYFDPSLNPTSTQAAKQAHIEQAAEKGLVCM